MASIGLKLRELRNRRQLTVRELATRSGVSHSTVSLVERDRMSPSIDTLSAILDALGTTISAFFLEERPGLAYRPFYEADELIEIRKGENISFRMIGANHPNRQILMLHETYAPGGDTGEEGVVHVGQEAGMVLKGEVELTVAGRTQRLKPGDSYYFDSELPHRFRNVSEGEAEVLSALTPPTY